MTHGKHHHEFARGGVTLGVVSLFVVRNSKTISQIKAHTYITGKKIAADFMDSAMNSERLNMGEVVGEMMEPFPIQISHWPIKPFNLTYWGCLYLKE